MSPAFEKFKAYLDKLNHYSRVINLLSWDMYTTTPKLGFDGMAATDTYFSTEYFALYTSDEFYELVKTLNEPEEYEQLTPGYQFTVRKYKKNLEKDRKIPKDFYERFTAARNESQRAWTEAKNAADFSIFAPHLEKMIEYTKQQLAYTDPGKDVYDTLLGLYEEGMDSATIDKVFEELKEGLLPLTKKILSAPQPDSSIFKGYYDPDAQKKVEKLLLSYMGFSFDAGVTAESEHPFTDGFSRYDVRVTNHFYEDNPFSSMFSAIHEGGHAIFEQNVDPALTGTAADDCCYMGVHESQSRFYENILGRNRNFWVPIYNKVQELLPELKRFSLDEFIRECNHIQASFIRTEADEVTYCMHILIRYEIEQAIFRDHVPASELPALWNQKYQEYLGITPANDAEGILQDMHWSDGSFGYFPTYLLGSIYDGMFLEALEKDLGSVDDILAAGEIRKITRWLNENIHWHGSLRLPKEVIEKVCQKELSAKPLLNYFEDKYSKIYQL